MSMNLHCDQVQLWQTPTYITRMCYSNGDGGSNGILYRYSCWVRSGGNSRNGFESLAAAEAWEAEVDNHLNQFKKFETLNFSIR